MQHEITSTTPAQKGLTDLFERSISYLRLSITDRCNLKCLYCVPAEEAAGCVGKLAHRELLSFEEMLRVVRVAVGMGITKLRLTGGEPLVRRNVLDFIRSLGAIDGLEDIRLTTNGVLLARHARDLYESGVTKVNISLDTLKPERFARITGHDLFAEVWNGLEQARAVGFSPIKINVVVMRGINDDELVDFAHLSQREALQIRFIEFMPIGSSTRWRKDVYVSSDELMQRLSRHGELLPMSRGRGDGPAQVFRFGEKAVGSLGFISPLSHKFCDRCNRLRLTSEGMLRSCLLHDAEIDLRAMLRQGCTDNQVQEALLTAIRNKPQGHLMEERLKEPGASCHGKMFRIGG